MFNKELFGDTLRLKRNINRHSLLKVQKITGVGLSTIHRYEQKKIEPLVNNVLILCREYLRLPVDLFSGDSSASALDLLAETSLSLHCFVTMARYLTDKQFSELSVIIKRYDDTANLFEDVQNSKLEEIND